MTADINKFEREFSYTCDVGFDNSNNKVIRILNINWPQNCDGISDVLLRLRGRDLKTNVTVDEDQRFQQKIKPGASRCLEIRAPLYGEFFLCFELLFKDGTSAALQTRKKLNLIVGHDKPYLSISTQQAGDFIKLRATSDCWPVIKGSVWLEYGATLQSMPDCASGEVVCYLPTDDIASVRLRYLPGLENVLDIKWQGNRMG